MMKTLKELIAVILCVAAIAGLNVTGAYAYEFGDEETFTYIDNESIHFYAGEEYFF